MQGMAYYEWLSLGLVIAMGLLAAAHAILTKRDPKAAMGWVAICVIFPLFGSILYFLFGINRVETRARILKAGAPGSRVASELAPGVRRESAAVHRVSRCLPPGSSRQGPV